MTTPEPNDHATLEDRRVTTADLSWMLWTAIGIGGIWIAVLLLSLLAPDLVSGSQQGHLPVAAFATWFWGAVGTMVFLWAMGRLRGYGTQLGEPTPVRTELSRRRMSLRRRLRRELPGTDEAPSRFS
jgi:hypothetical protein